MEWWGGWHGAYNRLHSIRLISSIMLTLLNLLVKSIGYKMGSIARYSGIMLSNNS